MTMPRFLTSLQNPIVKHLVKLRIESAYRYEQNMLVIEGLKPIKEIDVFVKRIFYTPAYIAEVQEIKGEKWEINEAILHKISGMSSPEGIVAEVAMPSFVTLNKSKRVLAFDGLNDPGNVGTLLRTALAFGWEMIYFLPNCCDPFNEKVLRAARGAHFKLHLSKGSLEELQQWIIKESVQPLVADLQGLLPEKVPVAKQRLLVMGNEARGPSKKLKELCQAITIPMSGEMESLNVGVAGGILLYLLADQKE